jgi:hypothetical protein
MRIEEQKKNNISEEEDGTWLNKQKCTKPSTGWVAEAGAGWVRNGDVASSIPNCGK